MKGFTQALSDELRREGHSGIKFTTVYPHFVQTGLTKHMKDRYNAQKVNINELISIQFYVDI